MGYVEPNGRIEIFKGINLDNRYMHTIYFANTTAQNNWFTSKLATNGRSFTRQYYTRQNNGVVRLRVPSDDILDYTYMRFQNKETGTPSSANDPHSTKWFYAFITSINYVNENTTEITFEIDVMQTWFFQTGHQILPCMVRREHTNDDTFGANLEAEPVGSEVYDNDTLSTDFDELFNGYSVVMCTTEEPVDVTEQGIFHGTHMFSTNMFDTVVDEIARTLGNWNIQERSAEITDLYMFPTQLIGDEGGEHTTSFDHPASFDNYTPKNRKLFSYPYAFLCLTTKDGDSAIYRWEYFDRSSVNHGLPTNIQFDMDANALAGGTVAIYPDVYNGIQNNFDAKVIMNNFPKCSYAIDAYQAWVANGGKTKLETQKLFAELKGNNALTASMFNGITSIGNAGMSGISNAYNLSDNKAANLPLIATQTGVNLATATGNAILNYERTKLNVDEALKKINFEFKDAYYQPNGVVGTQCANIAVGAGILGAHFFHCHVADDEAKRIDDFFSTFGYSVNRVKAPNLTGRQYWNFVKTEACVIGGNMPASSKEAIARIFDGGIFLWHNGDDIGNFTKHMSNGTIDNPIAS